VNVFVGGKVSVCLCDTAIAKYPRPAEVSFRQVVYTVSCNVFPPRTCFNVVKPSGK